MTRNEYIQALKQLPEDLKKKNGFREPFDYTPYKCIRTNKYDYYPELNCCIINQVPIQWIGAKTAVNPENPEHYAFMKKLSDNCLKTDIGIISISKHDGTMDCEPYRLLPCVKEHIRKKNLKKIPFENKMLYYDSKNIDLKNNPTMLLLAKCLFTATIHNVQCFIPEPNVPISEWTLTHMED